MAPPFRLMLVAGFTALLATAVTASPAVFGPNAGNNPQLLRRQIIPTEDGTCGPDNSRSCLGWELGECCSEYGYWYVPLFSPFPIGYNGLASYASAVAKYTKKASHREEGK